MPLMHIFTKMRQRKRSTRQESSSDYPPILNVRNLDNELAAFEKADQHATKPASDFLHMKLFV